VSARAYLPGLLLLASCGPSATAYEVDLVASERCTTRAGVETCDEAPADGRRTATLLVESRAEAVLIFLDQLLLVSSTTTDPLDATRRDAQRDLETGCVRRTEQRLQVQRFFDQIDGTFSWTEHSEGPQARCGQTPFGERGVDQLNGLRREEP
jgi:hypothetical protein